MIVPINKVDDEQQLQILRTHAVRGEIKPAAELSIDLIDTAKAHENCVGLASNQIWKNPDEPPPHVFVALVGGRWQTFINATSKRSGQYIPFNEGCMSKPGYKNRTTRRMTLLISYFDEEGRYQKHTYHGLDAIILQHELDHMTGKLI